MLNFAGAAHRIDDARELRQHAVAGGLDNPAVMLADLRTEQFAQLRLEALVRAFLIDTHQARIPHHIGGEDRRETAGGGRSGHCSDGADFRAKSNLLRAESAPISLTGRPRSFAIRGLDARPGCRLTGLTARGATAIT